MTPRPDPARTQVPGTPPGHRSGPQYSTVAVWGVAALEALAECLNRLGFPALRLAPCGKPAFVDVSLPGDMAPGERVYLQGGMFVWHNGQAAGRGDQPDAAADVITRTLRNAASASACHQRQGSRSR
jgi:hypothetical protein